MVVVSEGPLGIGPNTDGKFVTVRRSHLPRHRTG
jgi:hypothetical protein